jgi:hypothetical protein
MHALRVEEQARSHGQADGAERGDGNRLPSGRVRETLDAGRRRLMKRTLKAAIPAAVVLIAMAAGGCAALAGTATSAANPPRAAHGRFVGYKWLVTAITSHGKRTPITAADRFNNPVYVLFTPNGQFGANDPVNFHQATYSLVGDGFTTSNVAVTAVSYTGDNQVIILAMDAISAFGDGVHATATVTGNRLAISVDGFLLECQRDGSSGSSVF